MKKGILTLMCMVVIMAAGTSLMAQEVTIVLNPGWTWISYPSTDTVDFATAFGSFTPAVGDIFKSRWGSATYTSDGQWRGSISQLYPGYGYHYMSNRTVPVLVTFNAQQPASQVVVTTSEPMDITTNSATLDGNVASGDGNYVFVFLRGICWGTNPNPTFNDNYIDAGNGLGSFTISMTELTAGTTYYVRAFAVTPTGTFYGDEMVFVTLGGGGTIGDHDYIDLDLPSGLLWATCNVGANASEDYGDYFAWGEIQPKDTYNWTTYQHCNGSVATLTKYCSNPSYGYNGFADTLTILLPEDDVAAANWGSDWRMPTEEEWHELYQNTTCTRTTQNNVNGWLFTATNGNSLFLPGAGYRGNSSLYYEDYGYGFYWSSSLDTSNQYTITYAVYFSFGLDNCGISSFPRPNGLSVRPVRSAPQN